MSVICYTTKVISDNKIQVFISAPNKEQADEILDTLLSKHLVAGGLITNGPSRYWWQGKIEEAVYFNISAFSKVSNKQNIIEVVKSISYDEVPMIWFVNIDGNVEFLEWIESGIS
jgi:uncharacterized protein involved in tolerance to divalent cations